MRHRVVSGLVFAAITALSAGAHAFGGWMAQEAGFTPVEAIRIATSNGAGFLGEGDRVGTVAPGKLADLVVVRGDPASRIEDVENVELVLKDGVGYDPEKLVASVRGTVGLR